MFSINGSFLNFTKHHVSACAVMWWNKHHGSCRTVPLEDTFRNKLHKHLSKNILTVEMCLETILMFGYKLWLGEGTRWSLAFSSRTTFQKAMIDVRRQLNQLLQTFLQSSVHHKCHLQSITWGTRNRTCSLAIFLLIYYAQTSVYSDASLQYLSWTWTPRLFI